MNKTHKMRKLFTTIFAMIFLVVSLLGKPVVSQIPQPVTVIVRGETMAAVESAVVAHNGSVTSRIDIINAVVAEVPESQLAFLNNATGVTQVTRDRLVRLSTSSNSDVQIVDVEFSKAAGIKNIWASGNLGQDVTVALLDTGLDSTFNVLRREPDGSSNRLLAYYDAIEDQLYGSPFLLQSPRDPNGHGTHLAGIIGNSFYEDDDNEFRGVAPRVNLVAVRVLGEEGGGSYSDVLKGIQWVVENKDAYNIRVLNISMYAVPIAPYWADPYNLAVMAAWQAGIVVVASAGNTGPGPMSVGVPGNTPYIITVGAFTDHRTPADLSDDYIPEFSASGPTLDAFVKPDVIAPGAHIVSLMRNDTYLYEQYPERGLTDQYFEMSGTSMSTAVVSGIAALMLSDDPSLTPDQVKYRLMQTSRPQFAEVSGQTEAAYSIWQQGAGRVWAEDAVNSELAGEANRGLSIASDLAGQLHYQGWTTFDADSGEFKIIGGGFDSWADGYTTWSGDFTNFADGYDSWADYTTNWSDGFDSWADGFDSWADGFDSWADGFDIWADGFDNSWADKCTDTDGFDSWADGFDSWADSFDNSWSDGFDSWADYDVWSDGFDIWAVGFDIWADGFDIWADDYGDLEGCKKLPKDYTKWADGFDSWADGFAGWPGGIIGLTGAFSYWDGGYITWANGFDSWADGFDSWADSYPESCGIDGSVIDDKATELRSLVDGFDSWADGFDSWADGFDSWADGFDSWADGFDSWADGFDSWADGFDSWADGFDSWADSDDTPPECVDWADGFDSWADGFDSWADGFDSWADGFDSWADGFDSWADGFDSWADGFDIWADTVSNLSSSFTEWDGGYTLWMDGFDSWADGFDSWADVIIDPDWINDYLTNTTVPTSKAVGINLWVEE